MSIGRSMNLGNDIEPEWDEVTEPKKCEKCKEHEGIECVYYSEHEGYLCKPCYKNWLKIDKTIPVKNNNYKPHEKRYLEWLKEEK